MSGFYWNTASPTPLFEFSLSAGVLTVSATGIAKLLFEEQGTPGGLVEIDLSGRSWSIADDTATDEFVGRHGTTASVAWGSAMPFFAYLVNKDNTSAGVKLALSRDPRAGLSPASTDNIGYTSNAAAVSSQSNFFLAHTTNVGYNGVPCICIGSVRATCDASAGGVWTFEALAAGQDGYGKFQEGVSFTYPAGQNGNLTLTTPAVATYLYATGGDGTNDVPTWATNQGRYLYTITRTGLVTCSFDTASDSGNCTNGDLAANLVSYCPYKAARSTIYAKPGIGFIRANNTVGYGGIRRDALYSDGYVAFLYNNSSAGANANVYASANDDISIEFDYQAF